MKHTGLGIGMATSPPSPELSGPGLPAAISFETTIITALVTHSCSMVGASCVTGDEALADWVIAHLV